MFFIEVSYQKKKTIFRVSHTQGTQRILIFFKLRVTQDSFNFSKNFREVLTFNKSHENFFSRSRMRFS